MTESWKSVAFALAARLEHMAGYGDSCDEHVTFVEDCGYCADARAYTRFAAKCKASGIMLHDRFAGAMLVNIEDIPVTKLSPPAPPPPLPATATISVKTVLGSGDAPEYDEFGRARKTRQAEETTGPTKKAKPKTVTVVGLRDKGPWHHLQDPPYDNLFWCGGKSQFRHMEHPGGVTAGWDQVTCERCRTARRVGKPRAWGR